MLFAHALPDAYTLSIICIHCLARFLQMFRLIKVKPWAAALVLCMHCTAWHVLPAACKWCCYVLEFGLSLQNATEELERLGYAFDAVKKQLLGRLHELARKQIGFDTASVNSALQLHNGNATNGSNGSSGSKSHTGMPEVTDAVSQTFVDQPDDKAVR